MIESSYQWAKPGDPHWIDPDKVRSISLGAAGNERRGKVSTATNLERQWAKDFDAYRRLRRDGLQPARSDGAAKLEATASSREQIERA